MTHDDISYNHILVAMDGSERAEQVLPHVQALATKFGATVTLLRVVTMAGPLYAEPMMGVPPMIPGPGGMSSTNAAQIAEIQRQEAESYLHNLAERLRTQGLPVIHEQHEGPAAEIIVERARTLGVDLIAMTTHGRSGLGRLVFGSVAEQVLRHAPCPVLLVRVTSESLDQE